MLSNSSGGAVEFHIVLYGQGLSTSRGTDQVQWSDGDSFCFPGGGKTVHQADTDALIFSVSDEPDWRFRQVSPSPNGLVVPAMFRAEQIEAQLGVVHRSEGPQVTAGKSVSFATAGMHAQIAGALSPTMMAAVNTLQPGGVQRRHRHNDGPIYYHTRSAGFEWTEDTL